MTRVDPRLWNLSSVLVAAACTEPGIPIDESADEVGSETDGEADDSGESESSSDGLETGTESESADEGPECEVDRDCDPGMVCQDGNCVIDHGEYGCEYYGCPAGEQCIESVCVPIPELSPCVAPTLEEVLLPELPDVLAIEFTDVDADGDDEVLALRATEIVSVAADDTVVVSPLPQDMPSFDHMTALRLPGSPGSDLVLWSPNAAVMWVLVGDGLGGFTLASAVNGFATPASVATIDADLDGVDSLATAESEFPHALAWFPDVLAGEWTTIENASAEWIGAADLLGGPEPEMLTDYLCHLYVRQSPNWSLALELEPDDVGDCEWQVGPLVPDLTTALAIEYAPRGTTLHLWDVEAMTMEAGFMPGIATQSNVLVDFDGASTPTLALGGQDNLALVWDWSAFPAACVAELDHAATWVRAGDREGDGREELLMLGMDGVTMLRAP